MPQDAFHVRRLAQELNSLLVGGKINRVSQVDKDELTFIIYTGKSTVKLILSTNASNARVCLSLTEKEPAHVAPNFCMLLRKHLLGAEILSISQHEYERIIQIKLHCTSDFSSAERTLVCELMGKYSNIMLVENGVILGALKITALEDSTKRILLSGAKYQYPEPQDKLSVTDINGVSSLVETYRLSHGGFEDLDEFARFLFENVAGFAYPTLRELVRILPIDGFANELLTAFETLPINACVSYVNGSPSDYFAFPVSNGKQMPSLCRAEDEFYTTREQKKGFEDKKRKLASATRGLKKKQEKKVADTLERLRESESAEMNKVKGELITANLYRLQKGMKECQLENWYDPEYKPIKITLDELLSPQKNAERYFKIYNKQKRAKEILTPMLEKERAELAYTDSVLSSITLAEEIGDLKEIQSELIELGLLRAPKERAGAKRKEVETPFREYLYRDFRILAGRNNLQNDRLVRSASPNDLWLHTQKYHSSHVVILTDGRKVTDDVLLFAAEMCAYYSDGREGGKIPVDYCLKKYVKKPSKSKAGFVVYTDYETVMVTPNSHAEGLVK